MWGQNPSLRLPDHWWITCESSAVEDFLPTVKKLPAQLRAIGYALLGRDERGEHDRYGRSAARGAVIQQARAFDRLAASRRTRLLTALVPGLAESMESAWQSMRHLPLPVEVCDAPFHVAPGDDPSPEPAAGGSATWSWSLGFRWHWLVQMIELAAPLNVRTLSPAWLAASAPQLNRSFDQPLALLLAATIDGGTPCGEEVFDILCQSVGRDTESANVPPHAVQALLCASRPEGWDHVRQLMVADSRPEDLRQTILRAMRLAHPEAFCQMLEAIGQQGLVRFSTVVRALDHWLGLAWAVPGSEDLHSAVLEVVSFLRNPGRALEALGDGSGPPDQRAQRAYLALWALAYADAAHSIAQAELLLEADEVELRYVAAWHLARLPLPAALAARRRTLEDPDLRVALCGVRGALPEGHPGPVCLSDPAAFEPLERLVLRMPVSPVAFKAIVWPWTAWVARQDGVARQLIATLGSRSPHHLIPHLEAFDAAGRRLVVERLAAHNCCDDETRWTLLRLTADPEPEVYQAALSALSRVGIVPEDAPRLEGIARWLPEDLQPVMAQLLLSLEDEAAMDSAVRLLHARNRDQRYLGLSMLRQLAQADRHRAGCIELARKWLAGRRRLLPREQEAIDVIIASGDSAYTLDNALGLMNPAGRSRGVPPREHELQLATPAVPRLLKSLDRLVHKYRQEPIPCDDWRGTAQTVSLEDAGWRFPAPHFGRPADSQRQHLPLLPHWEQWYAERSAELCDADGLELVRAALYLKLTDPGTATAVHAWSSDLPQRHNVLRHLLPGENRVDLKYGEVVQTVVDWLILLHPPAGALEYLLAGLETVAARLWQAAPLRPAAEHAAGELDGVDWRESELVAAWSAAIEELTDLPLLPLDDDFVARYWRLLRWMDEPAPGVPRLRPTFDWVATAYLAGHATLDDVADHLLGPRALHQASLGGNFESLSEITALQPPPELAAILLRPEIRSWLNRCTAQLVQAELSGVPAPEIRQAVQSVTAFRGVQSLRQMLAALGEQGGATPEAPESELQPARIRAIIARTFPADDETPLQCAKHLREGLNLGEFDQQRLLQLPLVAPQWLEAAAAAIAWPGLTDAFYWLLAHRGYLWGTEPASPTGRAEAEAASPGSYAVGNFAVGTAPLPQLSPWERAIRQRTAIAARHRAEGQLDIAWLRRIRQQLSPQQWNVLLAAAQASASPSQAQRAKFIFAVLDGAASKKLLTEGIDRNHVQENVRLLGLLPLNGEPSHEALAARYRAMQRYRAHLSSLDPLARCEASGALATGLRNLAATAGFPDDLLLRLALEAPSLAELQGEGVCIQHQDLTLKLSVDAQGNPQFDIRQAGNVLKAVPAALKRLPQIVAFRERAVRLRRDTSAIAAALEAAMCRGDTFTARHLEPWSLHPTLWPRLAQLVLASSDHLGYPTSNLTLRDCAGREWPLKPNDRLRIAHPADLVRSNNHQQWQQECQQTGRQQPLRQVMRELYEPTAQEEQGDSNRFAGRRVRAAAALEACGRLGWMLDEHGHLMRSFPADGVTATLSITDAQSASAQNTGMQGQAAQNDVCELQTLSFHAPCGEKFPCGHVPLRVFSEVVRELERMVSAASAGLSQLPEEAASNGEPSSGKRRAATARGTTTGPLAKAYR